MGEADHDVTLQGAAPSQTRAFEPGMHAGGRYRIVRFIAAGAMGEVFAAEDLVVGGQVALKVLRSELAGSSEAVERLRREIALARKVSNRHICRLHDVGEHDGRVFLTMELLDGETLSEHIKSTGALALPEVERLAAQLVDGLAALHGAGIVHRDFKTGNVILVDDRAVLTDFGLARSVDAGRDAQLTAEATLLGTPAYMSPEQVEGRAATPASDIYSLGVVLFELLTGKLPFREDSAMATATARLHKPPPRLEGRWGAIVARCLEVDPTKRFARVEDVLSGKRRRSWIPLAIGGAGIATLTIVLATRTDEPAADAACPPASTKIAGMWDAATRAKIGARYEASKPYVVDAWRAHAKQLDSFVEQWTTRWDANCASPDRAADALLFGQRLACLDARLTDIRSYITGFAEATDVEAFAVSSPGEYPISSVSDCDNRALLRAQLPTPPSANRADIDKLNGRGNDLRAKLRLAVAENVAGEQLRPMFEEYAAVEARLIELGASAVAGELRYWRTMFVADRFGVEEADRVSATLVELAEQTRDDHLLVRALTQRVRQRGYGQSSYDIAANEAILERAEILAKRIGDPGSLRYDIAEARVPHALRAAQPDEVRRATAEQARLAAEAGLLSTASWHRLDLASLDADGAAAKQILAESVERLGANNLNLMEDYRRYTPVIARGGDARTALDLIRKAIELAKLAPRSQTAFGLHLLATQYAFQLGKRDEATAHAKAAVAATGKTELDAYSLLVDELRVRGYIEAARHVLALAKSVDGNETDRASLADAEIHLRFDTGEPLTGDWSSRVAALPEAERHEALALVEARNKRVDAALAHANALAEAPRLQALMRAEAYAETGRFDEVVRLLAPHRDTIHPTERFHSPARRRLLALYGIALVETGKHADAIAPLEQAQPSYDARAVEGRFALARALPDRERALRLANQARAEFAAMKRADKVAAIDAWLNSFAR